MKKLRVGSSTNFRATGGTVSLSFNTGTVVRRSQDRHWKKWILLLEIQSIILIHDVQLPSMNIWVHAESSGVWKSEQK